MNTNIEFSQLYEGLPSSLQTEINDLLGDISTTSFITLDTSSAESSTEPPMARLSTQIDIPETFEEILALIPENPVVDEEIIDDNDEDLVYSLPSSTLAIESEVIPEEDFSGSELELTNLPTILNNLPERLEIAATTTIISESKLRFSGAEWFDKINQYSKRVSVIGAGGISSWTALLLARLGLNLQIYDNDAYDKSNLAGQLLNRTEIGKNKAIGLSNLIHSTSAHAKVTAINVDYNSTLHNPTAIMILGIDNMYGRQNIFEQWARIYKGNPEALFVDGRLTAETYQIYAFTGTNSKAQERYRAELFTDGEADETACSFKQTAFMAAGIAHRICTHVVAFFTPEDTIPRVIPFFIEVTPYSETIINTP